MDRIIGHGPHSEKFAVAQQCIVGLTSWAACRFPINYTLISTMTAEVCLRIVNVIASNVGKQWALMQTLGQGGGYLSHCLCPKSFNCVSCIDQVEVSMAPQEQVISAEQTWEGPSCRGPDRAIVWSCCSYGQGTVINTSAKEQAVRPICFLLGGKRKQWGGVLHTVGDWHYLLKRSVEAFLLLHYSAQVGRSHFTSAGPGLSCHFIHIHYFIRLVTLSIGF